MPKLGHYQSSHEKSAVQEKFDVVSISFLLLLGTAPFTKFQDAEKSHFERGIDRNSIALSNYPIFLFFKDPAGTPSEFVSNLSKLAVSHIVPFFMRFVNECNKRPCLDALRVLLQKQRR